MSNIQHSERSRNKFKHHTTRLYESSNSGSAPQRQSSLRMIPRGFRGSELDRFNNRPNKPAPPVTHQSHQHGELPGAGLQRFLSPQCSNNKPTSIPNASIKYGERTYNSTSEKAQIHHNKTGRSHPDSSSTPHTNGQPPRQEEANTTAITVPECPPLEAVAGDRFVVFVASVKHPSGFLRFIESPGINLVTDFCRARVFPTWSLAMLAAIRVIGPVWGEYRVHVVQRGQYETGTSPDERAG